MGKIRKLHCPDCGSEDLSWPSFVTFNSRLQIWEGKIYDPTLLPEPAQEAFCMACLRHSKPAIIELDVAQEETVRDQRDRASLALNAAYNFRTGFQHINMPPGHVFENMLLALLMLYAKPDHIKGTRGRNPHLLLNLVRRMYSYERDRARDVETMLSRHDIQVTPIPDSTGEIRYDEASDRFFYIDRDGPGHLWRGPYELIGDVFEDLPYEAPDET